MGEDGTGQKVIHPKHALPVCGTPIVRDLEKARRRGEMTHEQLRMANIILERDELEETYNTDNFTIDYTNNPDDEDGDCVFDPDNRDENARNEDGERVPMYVVRLGQYLESALEQYSNYGFEELGRIGRYIDVNIKNCLIGDDEVYGYTSPVRQINIDNDMVGTPDEWIYPVLSAVSAHELFHKVQYEYLTMLHRIHDDDWIMEGTARWAEDAVFDDANFYINSATAMLLIPDLSLPSAEYFAVLFWKYVTEQYGEIEDEPQVGADLMVEMWDRIAGWRGDGLPLVDDLLQDITGLPFEWTFRQWLIANYAKDLADPYEEMYDYLEDEGTEYYRVAHEQTEEGYGEVRIERRFELNEDNNEVSLENEVDAWSARYYFVSIGEDVASISINIQGEEEGEFAWQILTQRDDEIVMICESNNDEFNRVIINEGLDRLVLICAARDNGGEFTVEVRGRSGGEIIHVPEDYETIQAAIDESEDGNIVLVQPGRYVENLDFEGKEITVGSLFLVSGNDDFIERTIIDGDSSGNVVIFENEESEDAEIIGFTITNGYNEHGGGIYCETSNPSITSCNITFNSAYFLGGGIHCLSSSPTITNCTINNNSAYQGGGIECQGNSNPTIYLCTISGNETEERGDNSYSNGGGIACYDGASPRISNCLISGNIAKIGGGIYAGQLGSSPIIGYCTISNNTAISGGGIYLFTSNSNVHHSIITGNRAENRGGGGIFIDHTIFRNQIYEPSIEWCIISDNSAATVGGGIHLVKATMPIYNCGIFSNSSEFGAAISIKGDRTNQPDVQIEECTISGNIADSLGGTIFLEYDSYLSINSTILWNDDTPEIVFSEDRPANRVSVRYSDLDGGEDDIETNNNGEVDWQEGNIEGYPNFVNPDNEDYHLTEESPCINAGDPDLPEDPDNTRADMGVFYFDHRPPNISVDSDQIEFVNPWLDTTDSVAIRICNLGIEELRVFSQYISPDDTPFVVGQGQGAFNLGADSSHTTWILFRPEIESVYHAVLSIESNDPTEAMIEIRLIGNALYAEEEVSILPISIEISGIYPNPFNSQTSIQYSIVKNDYVNLQVFNISGQRVATIENGFKEAGFHSVIWDSQNLPSAIYVIKLESAERTDYQKAILVK